MSLSGGIPATPPHLVEIKVADIQQLFNSMDPSPFHERDLDRDAEQFILSLAQECPSHAALKLLVHLGSEPHGVSDPQTMISESVRNFFEYRAGMIRREFRQLMRDGRMALVTGVAFLIVCEIIALLLPANRNTWHGMLREGLTIIGWVAMWRPVEIYLYRWWPVLRRERVYRALSAMQVEVKTLS